MQRSYKKLAHECGIVQVDDAKQCTKSRKPILMPLEDRSHNRFTSYGGAPVQRYQVKTPYATRKGEKKKPVLNLTSSKFQSRFHCVKERSSDERSSDHRADCPVASMYRRLKRGHCTSVVTLPCTVRVVGVCSYRGYEGL
jgi:hypothetical protein